jgi:hypothetical protein
MIDYFIIPLVVIAMIGMNYINRKIYMKNSERFTNDNYIINKNITQLVKENIILHANRLNATRIDFYLNSGKDVDLHINNVPVMTLPENTMNNILLAIPSIVSVTACLISIHKKKELNNLKSH